MDDAKTLLAKHGKSFWFASHLLRKEDAHDAASLYAACRILDDLADEDMPTPRENEQARDRLRHIQNRLLHDSLKEDPDPVVRILKDLAHRRGLNLNAASALIDTLTQDADENLCLQDDTELLRYCYGAAGTVGVMMAPLIGAPSSAWPHAIDLGIAMQLTNIARDISEDGALKRRYVPGDWVADAPPKALISPDEALAPTAARADLALLDLAERYYQSGADGFTEIPKRNRRAIQVAAEVYRGIGTRLRARDGQYWHARAYVPLRGKFALAFKSLTGSGGVTPAHRPVHDRELHRHLTGLPGTNPPC
ncbi:phytoene/squalene synthase family protein [Larsenimonas suaedae]|uniref:Phytoene/squalene synthase family protein n=1 Tax=Larsenimonas suaedae TaxID=1851019 RepID=A0ABU1GW77_9GAMM|nr:phytoene/squalene synthase family protein [Larsenimonas suaedae]MCM2970983.1 phytoene/squalene synthase family protein [Larsenimonas suaedae]MDR5895692.1 phytoene/squalene synthase family protein [Larsenimonas suaedae]